MSDPNSTSPDILSDGPVKDILRPGYEVFLTEKGGHLKILVQKAQVNVDLMLGHVSMYTSVVVVGFTIF